MSNPINPNVSEQKMQELAAIVADYIKAYPQTSGTVAPEIHRGAFDVALRLASAYPPTRGSAENTVQVIQLAIELLHRAYKLIQLGRPMAADPFVWGNAT